MMHGRLLLSDVMPVLFRVLVFFEVSLALGGVGCGIWALAAGKPAGPIVLTASAVVAFSGLLFLLVLPRINVPEEAPAEV